MALTFRPATPADIAACVDLRGRTRENAIPADRLAAMGITVESWGRDVESGALPGFVCTDEYRIAGYCFGDLASGEVVVLALLPDYESQGLGRQLLGLVTERLSAAGHQRFFLGCSADPATRSHGFYRHLGWSSTGTVDSHDDEVLEFFPADSRAPPESKMHEGSCHCGAVRLKLPSTPEVATDCNCSLCRRIGGPWVYFEFGTVEIQGHPEATAEYIWGDRTLRTIHCRTCAAVTHWEPLEPTPGCKHGVNLGNFDPRLQALVRVRKFDGADTWTFVDE